MGLVWNRINLLWQMRRFYWCLLACGLLLIAAGLLFNATNRICQLEEFQLVCNVQLKVAVQGEKASDKAKPWIHMVTPTYRRPEQLPELTRLSHTLQLVPRLHWIVVEDSFTCSAHLSAFLKKTRLPYSHLASPMPECFRGQAGLPRGVSGRRTALDYLKDLLSHEDPPLHGVLYFGDDDNTYDLQLFDEIRRTNGVSMFPVGLVGDYGISSPVVKNGQVVDFYDSWPADRVFQVDMAGFAIGTKFLLKHPNATMIYRPSYGEESFLQSLNIAKEDIEPLADDCTKVLVWHTKSAMNSMSEPPPSSTAIGTNLIALSKVLASWGVLTSDSKSTGDEPKGIF